MEKQKNNPPEAEQPVAGKTRKQKNRALKEIESLKKQCEEYKDGWARAQADYQNLQKEVEQKRSEWAQMSEMQIIEKFIPVYDNFKKAFANEQRTTNNEQQNWARGIEYIMKQFGKVLEDYGVEEVKTVGEQFDPNLHEAVGEEPAQGGSASDGEGVIVREVESGYKKESKIIKVAKVIVAKSNN
jgi:molecular chaperone GrpE